MLAQTSELGTEIIAYNSVNHKCAIHFARSGEHFAAGQVAPFVGADNPAGFHPAIIRVQIGYQISASESFSSNLSGAPQQLDHLHADAIDFEEIRPHAFQHDLPVDIHHVSVANPAAVDHVRHLHA